MKKAYVYKNKPSLQELKERIEKHFQENTEIPYPSWKKIGNRLDLYRRTEGTDTREPLKA